MEILDNVRVDTISMVKLGSKYYALKDEDAVRKSQLWEPEQAVTGELLKAYYQTSFYESLGAAVADVNAQTVGSGVTEDAESENVAVYTDEKGSTVVTLLADLTEPASVIFTKDAILRLNGKVLTFTESGTHLKFAETVSEAWIDGRVPGSRVVKSVAEETAAAERVLDMRAGSSRILGGKYQLNLANNSAASLALMVRNTQFYGEGFEIEATQNAGSGNLYTIMAYSPLKLQGCTVKCHTVGGIARCVETNADSQEVYINDCDFLAESLENTAVSFYPLCHNAVVRNSRIRAKRMGNSTENASSKATAIQQYADKLTVENCQLSASSVKKHTNCIYAYRGEYWIINTEIRAESAENYAYGVENLAAASGYLQDCVCFADATSGFTDSLCSTGVLNYGSLTLKNCSAYGTHSGMQLLPGSHTHATGGTFEGVGHGGIYFSHAGGSAFIQDAEIKNVKYRGAYKTTYEYLNQYGVAAMYIGSVDGNGGISVYMDNCGIDGSGPFANGAEPIRFRDSENEQNNAVYMSNCTVMGDGNIRFGNSSHRLYHGLSNRILTESNMAECLVQTSSVYHCDPGMPENMPEESL